MDPKLADYIAKARSTGISDDVIRKNLVDTGWDTKQVDVALGGIHSVPKPTPSQNKTIHTEQPNITPQTIKYKNRFMMALFYLSDKFILNKRLAVSLGIIFIGYSVVIIILAPILARFIELKDYLYFGIDIGYIIFFLHPVYAITYYYLALGLVITFFTAIPLIVSGEASLLEYIQFLRPVVTAVVMFIWHFQFVLLIRYIKLSKGKYKIINPILLLMIWHFLISILLLFFAKMGIEVTYSIFS